MTSFTFIVAAVCLPPLIAVIGAAVCLPPLIAVIGAATVCAIRDTLDKRV